jgi:2-methylcitrate dehydratase PrpD
MTGPSSILEGAHGFYAVYAGDAEAPARLRNHLETLGERWHVREAALKVRASCHYIQPFLECLETLLSRGLDAGNIASIHCEVPPGEESLICEPWAKKLRPSSAYQAKFSLPYALGALLADGVVTVATLRAGEARSLRVCCARDLVADGGRRLSQPLWRTPHRDHAVNEKLSVEVDDVRGTPAAICAGEVLRKFYDCRSCAPTRRPSGLRQLSTSWTVQRTSPRSRARFGVFVEGWRPIGKGMPHG